MHPDTHNRSIWFSLLLAGTAAACGGNSGASSAAETSKFLGRWTYQLGSALVIDCPGAPSQLIDLSRVPPANQPGYFTFSATSQALIHEVDARGCVYDWTVSGEVANAIPNQACTSFPDGRGGNQVVHLQTGTKSTSDGVSMNVDVHFTTDAGCAVVVRGTANKS